MRNMICIIQSPPIPHSPRCSVFASFYISLSSPTSFSPLSERSLRSQTCAQKQSGGTSWLQARTPLSFSPCLYQGAAITQSAPPSPSSSPSISLYVFFPLLYTFFSQRRQNGQKVLKCKHATYTLGGDRGALGPSDSEKGVSDNPLEVV